MIRTGFTLAALVCFTVARAVAQSPTPLLPPEALKAPLGNDWTSYSGDYTGQRFSRLTQVTPANVKHLTLAWAVRMNTDRRGNVVIGGEGDGTLPVGPASMKGSVLEVNGILYVTAPDHVWAMDGRDGRELWHYFWKTRGGTHIGNRGAAIWNDSLLFETPDNYLVSIDVHTGRENWHVEIADFDQQYFSTMAPIVVGDQVLVGTGNDLDAPGFLQSYDARTGKRNWIHYTVPMNPEDPGLDTWPSLDAARHGGGQVWVPGVYDPETDLYIFSTGNPTPGYTGISRKGDNLFTCTLMAVKMSTGKMAWYYQTSPHDTHDWDSAQTPVLIDGVIEGKTAQARVHRGAQWLFLHARPHHRRTHRHSALQQDRELGEGTAQVRAARARSGEIRHRAGIDRLADGTGRDQLAAASLQSGPGSLLCVGEQQLQPAVSHRPRSARLDGPGRQARVDPGFREQRGARHRLPHRQGGLASRMAAGRKHRRRLAGHRHRTAVRQRRQRQFRVTGCEERRTPLAHAHRQHHQCAADFRHRRSPAPARGRERHAVRVRPVLSTVERP